MMERTADIHEISFRNQMERISGKCRRVHVWCWLIDESEFCVCDASGQHCADGCDRWLQHLTPPVTWPIRNSLPHCRVPSSPMGHWIEAADSLTDRLTRSFSLKKNPRKKNPKISKRIHKIKEFLFEDLKFVYLFWKWTTPRFQCLNPFFIYKILVHQTKNFEKSEKIKEFFFLGFSHLFWEWTTIKSSYTIKNPEKI